MSSDRYDAMDFSNDGLARAQTRLAHECRRVTAERIAPPTLQFSAKFCLRDGQACEILITGLPEAHLRRGPLVIDYRDLVRGAL